MIVEIIDGYIRTMLVRSLINVLKRNNVYFFIKNILDG